MSEDEIISQSLNYAVRSYNFDLALKTKAGYFNVKGFEVNVVDTRGSEESCKYYKPEIYKPNVYSEDL